MNVSASHFETTLVFPTAAKNKPNHRIPSLVLVPTGDRLVTRERHKEEPGDNGNHHIVMTRSTDKGTTHYWNELHFARFNIKRLTAS